MLALAWTVYAVLAGAGAAATRPARVVDVHDALNHTVCPISIEFDEDPDRYPPVIKLYKCAREPAGSWCRAQGIPANECCARHGPDSVLECVELHEVTRVQYRRARGTTSRLYDVAVGCACMLSPVRHAKRLPVPDYQ